MTIRRRLLAQISKHSEEISTIQKTRQKKRFTWAKENLDRDRDKVIFSDKNSFWACSSIHRTWSTHTNRLIQQIVKQ